MISKGFKKYIISELYKEQFDNINKHKDLIQDYIYEKAMLLFRLEINESYEIIYHKNTVLDFLYKICYGLMIYDYEFIV